MLRYKLTVLFLLYLFLAKGVDYTIVNQKYLFENDSVAYSIAELIDNDTIFKPLSYYNDIIRKERNLNYWEIIKLKNNTKGKDLVFRNVSLWSEKIEVYQFDNKDKIYVQQAGMYLPKQEGGAYSATYIFFIIPYSSDEIVFYTHYIKREARPGPIIINSIDEVMKENNLFIGFSVFFFSALLIVLLLSFSMYVTGREKLYLFYALHVFFVIMYVLMDFEVIPQLFGGRPRYLVYLNMYTISFVGSIIALVYYTRAFFNTKITMPLIDNILLILVAGRLLIYVVSNFLVSGYWFGKLNQTFVDMPLTGFALFTGIYSIVKKQRYAWLFSISFFILFLAVVLPHFVPNSKLHINFPYLSMVWLETLLFFIAITLRLKVLNQEKELALLQTIGLKDKLISQLEEYDKLKDKVNRELEIKVAERTEEIKSQSEKIEQMNMLLEKHSIELKEDVENLEQARVMHQSLSFEEFAKKYPDDKSCYVFLSDKKWSAGYVCKKCENTRYSIHDNLERRKCSRCGSIESPTIGTFFQNVKFPLQKAFYLLYLFSSGKNPSFEELSKTLHLRTATIWTFKKKVDARIKEKKSFKKTKEGWTQLIF